MIPTQFEQCFAPHIRERGEAYVNTSALSIGQADASGASGTCQGTRMYGVFVHPRRGHVHMGCTCPYGREIGACKHLWALLRTLDRQGVLSALVENAGSTPLVTFETGGPASVSLDHGAVVNTRPKEPEWKTALTDTKSRQRAMLADASSLGRGTSLPSDRRLAYLLNITEVSRERGVRVEVATQRRDRDGVWDAPKRFQFAAESWFNAPEAIDRQIAEMLLGTAEAGGVTGMPPDGFIVRPRSFGTTLRAICDTGRAYLQSNRPSLNGRVISWDNGPSWHLTLRVEHPDDQPYQLIGDLQRDGISRPLSEADWIHDSGFVLFGNALSRLDTLQVWPLLQRLWKAGELELGEDPSAFLAEFHALPSMPRLSLPAGAMHTELDVEPTPVLQVTKGMEQWRRPVAFLSLRFQYGETSVDAASTVPTCFDKTTRTLYRRRMAVERNAMSRLRALGAQQMYSGPDSIMSFVVQPQALPRLVTTLIRDGWLVQGDGVTYIAPDPLQVRVQSDTEWFDVSGVLRFGDREVPLSRLLTAMDEQHDLIDFGDGLVGYLPDETLESLRALLTIGERRGDRIRFKTQQLALLDVLLLSLPDVDVDATLAAARAELHRFYGVNTVPVPPGFVGTLRGYQEEGLSWFGFLRRFGFGGCLADDMGLGKTVQVLAMLEARRTEGHGLSLLVVPRSLVFNWVLEAKRFTPELRMLDVSHSDRSMEDLDATDADVAITTYGTLRRDVARLGARQFDYVILDEAQAIKNSGTATAKACRVLQASHRLALSGTPIENRIEELWSLFEFLNPGMLGAARTFSAATRMLHGTATVPVTGAPSESPVGADVTPSHELLSRALRPVILRRTKAMVATELPDRTEQTLEVELEPKQRAFYEQIRQQYTESLMQRVERDGISKARMHILEALLRLRQAACHPSLVDPSKSALPSAKLDAVVPALMAIAAEGHKALVFSQFTSFLSVLRTRLDALGVPYEYLDGRTRDRQARVERFQSTDGPPLFLISLKAGGHGLNLTAAEYVYLLDPWWNPAVEAQAIDRAHRIGQTNHVIATRVVARDTIESKILDLQRSKRALADAILSEDKGGLSSIGRAELELLLG